MSAAVGTGVAVRSSIFPDRRGWFASLNIIHPSTARVMDRVAAIPNARTMISSSAAHWENGQRGDEFRTQNPCPPYFSASTKA